MTESGELSDHKASRQTSDENLDSDVSSSGHGERDVEKNIATQTQPQESDALSTQTPPDVEDEKAAPAALKPHQDAGKGAVPDGGLIAWLQVVAGWCIFFNTWGILNTFGVYQTYYESGQLWKGSSSDISWIGSIQALMVLVGGLAAGPLYDRGYFRYLLVVGSLLVVFGHMMLSLCTTYWQTLLAQGFTIGIGGGLLFIPALAIIPGYFNKKLGLAIGLAASGSSTGGVIYPIMFYKLIDQVGFAWSVRILGFTALATLLVPLAVMKMRFKPAKARAMLDMTAFTDWPYVMFVVGTMVGYIGLYCGFFYTSYYGQATGITDESLSFYLLPILNAGSVFGRTLPNFLSDKIGPLNVITPGACITGIILLCYMAATSPGALIVCSLLFGFFSGIFIALPPVIIVALTKDKTKIGTRIGMGFAFLGFGVLCGGPAAGAIVGSGKVLHWNPLWTYAGITTIASSVSLGALRVLRCGFKPYVKA